MMKINTGKLICLVLLLDQLTKRFIYQIGAWKISPCVYFEPAWNSGVSFSLLATMHPLLLTTGTFLVMCYLIYLLSVTKNQVEKLALALIIGGAAGNLLDRLLFSKVFDFIVLQYGSWRFPTFNLADVGITFGAAILLYDVLFSSSGTRASKGSKSVK